MAAEKGSNTEQLLIAEIGERSHALIGDFIAALENTPEYNEAAGARFLDRKSPTQQLTDGPLVFRLGNHLYDVQHFYDVPRHYHPDEYIQEEMYIRKYDPEAPSVNKPGRLVDELYLSSIFKEKDGEVLEFGEIHYGNYIHLASNGVYVEDPAQAFDKVAQTFGDILQNVDREQASDSITPLKPGEEFRQLEKDIPMVVQEMVNSIIARNTVDDGSSKVYIWEFGMAMANDLHVSLGEARKNRWLNNAIRLYKSYGWEIVEGVDLPDNDSVSGENRPYIIVKPLEEETE